MDKIKCIGATLALVNSGKKVGPYFIGLSLEAIKKKFSNKLTSTNLEIVEIDVIHIKNLPGYQRALEKLNNGYTAVMVS